MKNLFASKETKLTNAIAKIKDGLTYSTLSHESALRELEVLNNNYPDHTMIINRAVVEVRTAAEKITNDENENAVKVARAQLKSAQWELTDLIEQNNAKVTIYAKELAVLDPNSREYQQKYKLLEKIYKELEEAENTREMIEHQLDILSVETSVSGNKLNQIISAIMDAVSAIVQKTKKTVTEVGKDWGILFEAGTLNRMHRSPYDILKQNSQDNGLYEDGGRIDIERERRNNDLAALIAEQKDAGKIREANEMLSHPFSIDSVIEHGFERGRTIGIPTINQSLKNGTVIPKHGVYAGYVTVEGAKYKCVTNIGVRPTVNGTDANAETHIINYKEDLYGEYVSVQLTDYLREEKHFDNLEELKNAILQDIKKAEQIMDV